MSEPDHFLARWARRKRLVGEEQAAPEPDAVKVNKPAPNEALSGEPAAAQKSQAASKIEPAFDPASLPSLDSIGADTDIGPFLKTGVPSELRHAALRRAWSTDPAIREFKGLQENDWNFNDPNGIPGFGELSPTTDIKKMLGDLFGDTRREAEAAAGQLGTPKQLVPPSNELAVISEEEAHQRDELTQQEKFNPAHRAGIDAEEISHRNINIGSKDAQPDTGSSPIKRRRGHGGALPQ
jgi:hypothetical protein